MSNPKAQRGVSLRLSSPAAVMVATAAAVFFSLSDHRIEDAAVAAASPTVLQVTTVSDDGTISSATASVAKPRDRLVVASIRPRQSLLAAMLPRRVSANTEANLSSAPASAGLRANPPTQFAASSTTVSEAAGEDSATDAPAFSWSLAAPSVGPPIPPTVVEDAIAESRSLPEPGQAAALAESDAVADAVAAAPTPVVSAAPAVSETRSPASVRHELPFSPLLEPALSGTKAGKTSAIDGFEALISADEIHTARAAREVEHKVKAGEAFSTVLERHGCGPKEASRWLAAVRDHHDPNRIYAGQVIKLLLDMPEKRLRRISIEIGRGNSLVVEDTGRELVARTKTAPSETTVRVVEGEISSSLYEVATANGVPDRVISDAAEVLGWEINFGRDLQPGARFRLAYEQTLRLDTREATPGRLLAIELLNTGKRYEGFYFATANGTTSGYYNRKGEGLGRAFLRYPVSFSRISSKFTASRYHPVLKRNRPHYGVDFAAPTGTPVKAVADGTVTLAGWHGGNGRFVKLRHDKRYESGYAHLSRIASGIRSGTRVRQGQVIGYVGSTGLATGPHLHFAMYSNGKYIDPLHASLPRTTPLSATSLVAFRSQLTKIDGVYASNGMTAFGVDRPATAAAPTGSAKRR
jgi:murein DD-endopeptidase MepM/ murein hydrolase activator NlpD